VNQYPACSCCGRPGTYWWPHYTCRGCEPEWFRIKTELDERVEREKGAAFAKLKQERTEARLASGDEERCDWSHGHEWAVLK
jgi:hypothetical protein